MKKILIILISIAAIACDKYKAKEPDASFVIKQNDVVLVSGVDSVKYNLNFVLQHTGTADKVVFFLGTNAHKYSKADNKGQPADKYGRITGQKFTIPGIMDTITCIATTIGDYGNEIKQVRSEQAFYIKK